MILRVTAGPDAGKVIEPAGDRFTVGREGVDFLLLDGEASRQHIALRVLPDGGLEVSDLGSSNGTYLNGVRLTEPRVLSGGEEIRIGTTVMTVEAGAPGDATIVAAPSPAPVPAAPAGAPAPPTEPQPATPPPPTPPRPTPQPAAAPQPPAPQPAATPAYAAGPTGPKGDEAPMALRATGVVLTTILLIGALIFVAGAIIALGWPICGEEGLFDRNCYDNTEGRRTISSIMIFAGGIAAVLSFVFSIIYIARSRRGAAMLITGLVGLLLVVGGIAISEF